MDNEDLLTIAQAAPLVGMAATTLRDKVTAGEVPHLRISGRRGVRFTQEHVRQIRARQEVPVGVTFPNRPRAGSRPAMPVDSDAPASSRLPVEALAGLAEFAGLRSLRAG